MSLMKEALQLRETLRAQDARTEKAQRQAAGQKLADEFNAFACMDGEAKAQYAGHATAKFRSTNAYDPPVLTKALTLLQIDDVVIGRGSPLGLSSTPTYYVKTTCQCGQTAWAQAQFDRYREDTSFVGQVARALDKNVTCFWCDPAHLQAPACPMCGKK